MSYFLKFLRRTSGPHIALIIFALIVAFLISNEAFARLYPDYEGMGVLQGNSGAPKKHTPASKHELANAQFKVGKLLGAHANSTDNSKDHEEAVLWYMKAAENGHLTAQIYLAARYMRGKGVRQDHEQARYWFLRAAKQGDAIAFYVLGKMSLNGSRTPKQVDISKVAPVQRLIQYGVGNREKNMEQAYYWFGLAATSETVISTFSPADAIADMNKLAPRMTLRQKEDAMKKGLLWLATSPGYQPTSK